MRFSISMERSWAVRILRSYSFSSKVGATEASFLIRNAWLVPFFPLLGGAIAAVGARQLKERAHIPVVAGIALAFLVALGLLFSAGPEVTTVVSSFLDAGGLHVPIEFRVDGGDDPSGHGAWVLLCDRQGRRRRRGYREQ